MEMTAENPDLQKLVLGYIEMFWRRKIWIVIPFLVGIIISGILVLYLPNAYLSSTLILVEGQKVPENIVQSAVTGSVEGRLSTIRQQILSRSFLMRLVGKYHLDEGKTPSLLGNIIDKWGLDRYIRGRSPKKSHEEVIATMRKNINIKTIGGGGRRRIDGFSIAFEWHDPSVTMNVTNELASLFIEENLKIREQQVEGTTVFLDEELAISKEELERQEQAIGDFKRRYLGELPEQLNANLRTLDRFQSDLLSIQFEKKSIQSRISLLENSLRRIQRQIRNGDVKNILLDSSGMVLSPLEVELRGKQALLSRLRLDYREDYPDVRILKNQVAELESQLARNRSNKPLMSEAIGGNEDLSGSISTVSSTAVIDYENQIKSAKIELGSVETRGTRIRKQIVIYQKRVENVPSREQELAILLRDYENTQGNYQTLLAKKLNAKISENLEKRQKGEQFRVIDSANLPEKPIRPDRLKIGFLGIFLGLGGGIALAFLREQLDSSYREPEEIERVTSIPVLATIPDFTEEMLEKKG